MSSNKALVCKEVGWFIRKLVQQICSVLILFFLQLDCLNTIFLLISYNKNKLCIEIGISNLRGRPLLMSLYYILSVHALKVVDS